MRRSPRATSSSTSGIRPSEASTPAISPALLRQVTRDAEGTMRVGSSVGDPVEASVAFSFLGQAIDALGCPVPPAEAADHVSRVSDARSAQFHRVLRFLRGSGEPTLLALDDLQWADSDSVAMLSFLCRRLAGLPVAVVATLRPWPPSAGDVAGRLPGSHPDLRSAGDARANDPLFRGERRRLPEPR